MKRWAVVLLIVIISQIVSHNTANAAQFTTDFNYSDQNEMREDGWTLTQPDSITFTKPGIILRGGSAVGIYNIPAGLFDCKVNVGGWWYGDGHSYVNVQLNTENHTYLWVADGSKGQYIFYRDGINTLHFDGYSEKPGPVTDMTIQKVGNTFALYGNRTLYGRYVDEDNKLGNVTGVSINAPPSGTVKFVYGGIYGLEPDLYLDDVALIQVVREPEALVMNKNTAVCVDITSTFKEPVNVEIEITYDFGSKTYIEKGRQGNGVSIHPGINRVYIAGGPALPGDPQPWQAPNEGDFLVWTESGQDNGIIIRIDPRDQIREYDEHNNDKTLSAKVIQTKNLNILVEWVYFPNEGMGQANVANQSSEFKAIIMKGIEDNARFIIDNYPVSEDGIRVDFVQNPIAWPDPIPYGVSWDDWLYENVGIPMSTQAVLAGYDRVVILVHYVFKDAYAMGMERVPENRVPILMNHLFIWKTEVALAHEVGHTFYLWHPHDVCKNMSGLNNQNSTRYDLSSRDYEDSVNNLMAYGDDPFWIDEQRYDSAPRTSIEYGKNMFTVWNLMDQFRKGGDPEVLLISGVINKNSTITAKDPWYRMMSDTIDLQEGSEGNYKIVMRDAYGNTLGRFGFNASFAYMITRNGTLVQASSDTVPFFFRIPFLQNTSKIEILGPDDAVQLSRNVSSTPPIVTMTSPNDGSIAYEGEILDLAWGTYDADGDNLTSLILYSPDNGSSWVPLKSVIDGNKYEWNTSGLTPGSYLVKVITSDGVNTGNGMSGAFTIESRKASSALGCAVSSLKIASGDSISISGKLIPSLQSANISLAITDPKGKSVEIGVLTDSDGAYAYSFKPVGTGNWTVQASWPGNQFSQGATSAQAQWVVEPNASSPGLTPYLGVLIAVGILALLTILYLTKLRHKKINLVTPSRTLAPDNNLPNPH